MAFWAPLEGSFTAARPTNYGTAGFRTVGSFVAPIAYRMAPLLLLRGCALLRKRGGASHGPLALGAMITASHNASEDNGLKLVEPDGAMLVEAWEGLATEIVAAQDFSSFCRILERIRESEVGVGADELRELAHHVFIFVGGDTRQTTPAVAASLVQGLTALGCIRHLNFGNDVTTPMLHWFVWTANKHYNGPWALQRQLTPVLEEFASLGSSETTASDDVVNKWKGAYAGHLAAAFNGAVDLLTRSGGPGAAAFATPRRVVVDCANGVGALSMARLMPLLHHFAFTLSCADHLKIERLNEQCGADYCQKTKRVASEVLVHIDNHRKQLASASQAPNAFSVYSLDGDADRVVAFDPALIAAVTTANSSDEAMLDGDRIMVLLAQALRQVINEVVHRVDKHLEATASDWKASPLRAKLTQPDVAVVQTAYANGGATLFVRNQLKLEPYCAATGVKHLHPVAHHHDIGLYFEANGHGTVLVRGLYAATTRDGDHHTTIAGVLRHIAESPEHFGALAADSARLALSFAAVLSQACGDAIADMLAVELALAITGASGRCHGDESPFTPWRLQYDDLPSVQIKVTVPNPGRITNTPDQRRALTPDGLQAAIDDAVAATQDDKARSFVRPSGTEPIVRVYAEASTAAGAAQLGATVKAIVERYLP